MQTDKLDDVFSNSNDKEAEEIEGGVKIFIKYCESKKDFEDFAYRILSDSGIC